MLSVNEEAVIVRGVTKRRPDLHAELEASFPLLQLHSHLFTALKQIAQVAHAYASWVRGEGGGQRGGCTGRRSQEVACPFTVISASAALFYLHQISGCFVVVI